MALKQICILYLWTRINLQIFRAREMKLASSGYRSIHVDRRDRQKLIVFVNRLRVSRCTGNPWFVFSRGNALEKITKKKKKKKEEKKKSEKRQRGSATRECTNVLGSVYFISTIADYGAMDLFFKITMHHISAAAWQPGKARR